MDVKLWLPFYKPKPTARVRLFCFPFAGGGATAYRTWAEGLPPEIDVCAVSLPGREARFNDPPFTSMPALVKALHAGLSPLLTGPFAFFGHSMGGLIAFELTRQLRRTGAALPAHLFLSGSQAPRRVPEQPKLGRLTDEQLIARLRAYNGTPAEVLEHPVLMELLLPTLRADFLVLDDYVYAQEPPLDVPATLLGGAADATVRPAHLEDWKELVRPGAEVVVLPGDHFFIQPQQPTVLARVAAVLKGG